LSPSASAQASPAIQSWPIRNACAMPWAVAGQELVKERYGYANVGTIVEHRLNEIFVVLISWMQGLCSQDDMPPHPTNGSTMASFGLSRLVSCMGGWS
jgi:hypothetical protein